MTDTRTACTLIALWTFRMLSRRKKVLVDEL
jgi:hypothetical protein